MTNSEIDIVRDDINELRSGHVNLLTTVASLKEKSDNIKYTASQHATEIGNLRQITGKYSSLIEFMNDQIQELIKQKAELMECSSSAKDAVVKLQSYEVICEEKFKNIAMVIDRVREKGEDSDKYLTEKISGLSAKITDINEQLKVFKKYIWSIAGSIIIWALGQIAAAKGLI